MRQGSAWIRYGLAAALFGAVVGKGPAQDPRAELRAQIAEQARQIEELKRRIDARLAARRPVPTDPDPKLDQGAVKKIIADYLKDNPGAGMPPSVQTGYQLGQGFVIRSAPDPTYVKWDDDSKIPFEMRFRGRFQFTYDYYKVTDRTNHLTNQPATQDANATRLADFSQLEIKRGNFIFEGTAFDPDLRYRLEFNGFTRGLPGFQNNKVVQTAPAGGAAPSTSGVSPLGGGVLEDNGLSLFQGWIAYDFHGCAAAKGCGPDCPDDQPKYRPTYTVIVGKMKPFFGLDEFLSNANMQFVEFSMTDLFFDADDDTRMMAAGFQVQQLEDRFFLQAIITNGSEAFFPNSQMDNYPGFIAGWWYDFGGSWNAQRKAWDLYGDSITDIDYSCRPVVRVGGCVDLVPMNRRSLYGDDEQSRYFTMPAAPGGSRLINILNGDLAAPAGTHAVDMFDAYAYSAFVAGKYRGFSLENEWWVRDFDNFRTVPSGRGDIIYQDTLGPGGSNANALFPAHHGLLDYGMELSAGYFLIPRKLEVAARWAWIRGESGDINGNGTFRLVQVPGVTGPVQVVNGAFRNYHEADEYTLAINYYFKRHLLKWQTDFGIYQGGNPVGLSGQSIGGFVGAADGYLIRTQLQLFF